jgi:hypothetical protein
LLYEEHGVFFASCEEKVGIAIAHVKKRPQCRDNSSSAAGNAAEQINSCAPGGWQISCRKNPMGWILTPYGTTS